MSTSTNGHSHESPGAVHPNPQPVALVKPPSVTDIAGLRVAYGLRPSIAPAARTHIKRLASSASPELLDVMISTLQRHKELGGRHKSADDLVKDLRRADEVENLALAYRDLAQNLDDEGLALRADVAAETRSVTTDMQWSVDLKGDDSLANDLAAVKAASKKPRGKASPAHKAAVAAKRAARLAARVEQQRHREVVALARLEASKKELARLQAKGSALPGGPTGDVKAGQTGPTPPAPAHP